MRDRCKRGLSIVCLALSGCGAELGPDELSEPELVAIEIVSGDKQIQGRGRDLHEPVVVRAVVRPSFIARLDSESRFREWMTHVTGHGLGFGIFWGSLLHNPIDEAGVGADTHFPDAATVAAFDAAGGGEWTGGSKVPVENAAENRDVHWRGDVFGHEIMSSWYTMAMPGDGPPLSAITVQSVAALGYQVDVNMADPYELPKADRAADEDRRLPDGGGVPPHGGCVELIYDGSRIVGIVGR